MRPLSGIIRRVRNSLGFGVHSPLAFSLLGRVVAPSSKEGYYGYHDIDAAAYNAKTEGRSLPPRAVERAGLLLRLAAETMPESVFIPASAPDIWRLAVRLADSRIRLTDRNPERASLVVTGAGFHPSEALLGRLASGGTSLMAFDIGRGGIDVLERVLKSGILFEDGSSALAVGQERTLPQVYRILPIYF